MREFDFFVVSRRVGQLEKHFLSKGLTRKMSGGMGPLHYFSAPLTSEIFIDRICTLTSIQEEWV